MLEKLPTEQAQLWFVVLFYFQDLWEIGISTLNGKAALVKKESQGFLAG